MRKRPQHSRPAGYSLVVSLLTVVALALAPLALVVSSAEAAGNKAPKLSPIGTRSVHAGRVLVIRPHAKDPDHGPKKLRFRTTHRPSWLHLNTKSGVMRGRAPISKAGRSWPVTLKVSDGRATTKRSFRVRIPADRAPVLDAIAAREVITGHKLTITPKAKDLDHGPKALRYSTTGRPSWLKLNTTTGQMSGTPTAAGTSRIVLSVSDGLKKASRSFTVKAVKPTPANHNPVFTPPSFDFENVPEDSVGGSVVGTVTAKDSDRITYEITKGNLGDAFAIAPNTGKLTVKSALDYESTKSYTLTVRAFDGTGSAYAKVTVTVQDVNEAPSVTKIDDQQATEDTAITPIAVAASDPDAGDEVTLTVDGLPAGVSYADKKITGTPTVPGTYDVTVTATDKAGLVGTTTFTIKVANVNDAPVIEDQQFHVEKNAAPGTLVGQVVATDEDIDQGIGDTLTYTSTSPGFHVAADGTITVGDADLSVAGATFPLEVSVSDGNGGEASATVTITVGADHAPVITTDQQFQVHEDAMPGAPVGTVQATDADGDTIGYAITDGNADGAFAINAATGELTVAGPLDFETTPSYDLTVTATAGDKTATGTVTVTVQDVNEAPSVTKIDDQQATEDSAITPITVAATDPDQGDEVTLTVADLPAGVTYADKKISGTPTVPGTYDVTVTATDKAGLVGTTTFTITVANVNDAPVITPVDDVTATEDTAITPIKVTATDEDGDHVTFDVSTLPAGLTWDAATATISGTPTQGGDHRVTVTAHDGNGGTDSDTFAIHVENVNDAPVIASIDPTSIAGTVGEALDKTVTVVASDEDDDAVTLSAEDLPAGLKATDNGDSTITITGTPTEAGDTTAHIVATDPSKASDTADLAVSIASTCSPRSTLACAAVPVDLPYSLTFDGTEGGLGGTGFTMVDPPSHRDNVDQAPAPTTPSDPDVPGYEPSLVATAGGNLSLTATKGIMYRFPGTGGSDGTNSQLNTLGVGVRGADGGYQVETTLVAPTFPASGSDSATGSQQGGLWFGLGEDDYVKAAVVRVTSSTSKVQLVTESGSVAIPSTTYELDSTPIPAGQDVRLVLRADDTTGDGGTVSLQYAVNGGALTQLTDTANTVNHTALPVPQNLFTGVSLDGDAGRASFAGLYTTKRNAAAADNIAVKFAGFEVSGLEAPDTTAPAAPANLAASVEDGSVALTWDANSEADLAGYRVYRSTSADVPTTGAGIAGLLTAPAYEDATATPGTEYHYAVVAVDKSGNASAPSAAVTATVPAGPGLHEKYVFQPATPATGQTTPAGYTKNDGSAWTDAAGLGWVTQASLSQATHTPVDLTANTRYRNRAGISALQNSMIHLQYGDVDGGTGTSGNKTAGAFERAVPDGWYAVTVSVGDQMGATAYDSVHNVEVEGVTAIDHFQATAAHEYQTGTATVHVTDGRLTVDAIGGTNTKLNYLEVDSTTAPTEADVHQKVRFADETSAPPAGYAKDFGQAYGARTGADQGTGLTYGWEAIATDQPLSLVGNGRNRLTTNPAAPAGTTALHAGVMHMQLPDNASSGVKTPGYWEMAVPNGVYKVSVSTGDATAVDSEDWLNIEDQNAIAAFVPSGADGTATHWAEATRTVTVSDGRLTITPKGGTNTKINWVTIDSVAGASGRPSVRTPNPGNLATGVAPETTSVVNDLRLPNGGVEGASLTSSSVRLTRVSDGVQIPAGAATSGGSDTINLSPTDALDPNTLYRFELTEDATDITGAHFLPYSIVFTTGASASSGAVAFDKTDSGAAHGAMYTSLVKGPDGKMYAGSINGQIYRFDIASDGTLTNRTTITTVQDYSASHDTYQPGTRTVIGLAFDPASTASNPILWITDDAAFLGTQNVPQFSGRVAKLTGPNLGTYQPILTGLPRSVKDHETNSAAFGPDGALYITQGADNAMGGADGTWQNRPETLLTASVLRLDPTKLPASAQLPVDVQTQSFDSATGNVKTTNGPSKNTGPYYDPYAAGAPLTLYGHGIRNAFDLVWHSNGHLYTPTNGSAAGGNTPAVPNPLPASCANRPDGGYTGGKPGAITNNPDAETDYVFDVKKGGYYGHPNPERCEYVLAGGNPTSGKDPFEVPSYPVGTQPDPNLNLSDVYDAGLHASADGAIEYKGGAFGGSLNGRLLYVRYSSGQDVASFDVSASGHLSNRTSIIPGLAQPLDIAEDNATGNLYVSQLTDNSANTSIVLLKPQGGGGGSVGTATDRLVFSGQSGATSATRNAVVTNTGVDPLTITAASLGGDDAGQFVQTGGPTYPVTVPAGGSAQIPVAFKPTSTGVKSASLGLATDAGAKTVRLRGLAAAGLGGSNEPSLKQIMSTLEIPIDVGDATSNASTMIGDEVPAQLFEKAKDDSPISITPVAAYGPQDKDPAIKVGWYEAGDATKLHQQFTVAAGDAQGLMIAPAGTTDNIDPSSTQFGFYSDWPSLGDQKPFTQDALNTWDTAHPHHVRAYPLKNADGTVEPNAYVLATEEVTSSPRDTQDVVLIVQNVKPAVAQAPNAVLSTTNLDGVPYDDRLVMSRLQNNDPAAGGTKPVQLTHDVSSLRINNTGTEPMQVTGLDIVGSFQLVNGPSLPLTVAAGGHADLSVKFTATGGDLNTGSLTITSNAGTNGVKTVQLAGFWQSQSENNQEPSVREIGQLFGYTTNIPANLNEDGSVTAVGDEVLSPYWRAADTTKAVNLRQLTAYHTYPNQAPVRWFKQGAGNTEIFNINGQFAQSILPTLSGSTTAPAAGTFTPGASVFGFNIDGESSDDTKNNATPDHTNGCTDPCGHHVRFFPIKDRAGNLVPSTYLMIMDYSGVNYDYNDNTYLISNIRPEKLQTPQGLAATPGDGTVTLTWSPTTDDGVKYRVYRGTSPSVAVGGTGASAAVEVTPTGSAGAITATTFTDAGLANGTTYYYIVRAVIPGTANSDSTPAVAATPHVAGAFEEKVNFQNAAAPVPAGYLRDYGQAFGARTGTDQGSGLFYGWLGESGGQPLDLSVGGTSGPGNGRDRNVESDQRLDTFLHMQAEDVPNFNGTAVNGQWEMAVPDGQYAVTVAVGDPAANTDPESHTLNVEGVKAIDGFVPSGPAGSATHHKTATVTVTVADGRLTLDALGGTNTKIDYVDVIGVG